MSSGPRARRLNVRPRGRRLGAIAVLGVVVSGIIAVGAARRAAAQAPAPVRAPRSEPEIKAEFVQRFTAFVEWPEATFADHDAGFLVCVAGSGPVADQVVTVARMRVFKGRRAHVRRLGPREPAGRCHLLFIAATEEPRLGELLATVADQPVLTVGDGPGFGARGALINFFRQGENVRFEVNAEAVKRGGLRFNARLLQLARFVGPSAANR